MIVTLADVFPCPRPWYNHVISDNLGIDLYMILCILRVSYGSASKEVVMWIDISSISN